LQPPRVVASPVKGTDVNDGTRECSRCGQSLDGLSYRFKKHPACSEPEVHRTRKCTWCDTEFTYKKSRGTDRTYCSIGCRRSRHASLAEPVLDRCTVENCSTPIRSSGSSYCEMHYGRMRRNGHLEPTVRRGNGTCHYCGGLAPGKLVFCTPLCATRERAGRPLDKRACAVCDVEIPAASHWRRIYCGRECRWIAFRARRYDVPVKQYQNDMRAGCAICGETRQDLVTDHSHKTGRYRAMLCGSCNVGLGMFKDDQSLLLLAVGYLSQHAESS